VCDSRLPSGVALPDGCNFTTKKYWLPELFQRISGSLLSPIKSSQPGEAHGSPATNIRLLMS
jgi:hypothetical protein